MARYVLAQWDYTAEGNFELSFKEGDKIKLLEKHNDDWWEGELNDEIGFFPANRTKVYSQDEQQQQGIDLVKKASVSSTTSSSSVASRTMTTSGNSVQHKNAPTSSERSMLLAAGSNNSTPHNSNPYHQQQVQQQATSVKEIGNHRESVSAPSAMPRVAAVNENILVDISTENESKDNETAAAADPTTALFFNAAAATSDHHQDIKSPLQDAAPSAAPPNLLKRLQDMDMNEKPVYDIQKLNLEALHPNWIRIQGSMQIKVVSSTTGETQLPWKDYYGVLSHGFLLVYKEGLHKLGRRPSSMKPVPAYFTIDLNSSDIKPATKSDTRKKHAFIINLLLAHHQYTVLVHVQNESLFAEWLDAMMRDMIHVKEHTEEQDVDLVQLLASIPLQHILEPTTATTTTMTAISTDDTATEDPSLGTTTGGGGGGGGGGSKSLTRWFSRSSRNNSVHRSQTLPTPSAVSSTASASTAIHQGHDAVFGGPLKLEPDGQIPLVVRLCIQQVDQRGLDVVGIYRLSGQTTSIQKYKAMFNSTTTDPQQQQQQASIMHQHLEQEHDINVITGLLKLYFRQLKNPLLTFEYYDRFIEAARLQDYDERMFRLKSIIQVLPVVNYKVLYHVARHLERVKENSHINKMEASNLALIFSMGLLRPKHDDVSASIMHNDLSSTIVETIITHVDWFFDTDTTSTTTATSTITTDEEEDNASSVLVHENTQ